MIISFEPFIFAINLNGVLSSNIFNSLIFVFICKGITVLSMKFQFLL